MAPSVDRDRRPVNVIQNVCAYIVCVMRRARAHVNSTVSAPSAYSLLSTSAILHVDAYNLSTLFTVHIHLSC